MYWWYGYPSYPPMPFDLGYMMTSMMYWMFYPYYYSMMFEMFKTALEAWKKAIEGLPKA